MKYFGAKLCLWNGIPTFIKRSVLFKVNVTQKFLLMKNINLNVLISNFDIKLFKTELFFSYSLLKIKFLHKKVSGDLGQVFGLVT